ncbi:DUF4386 domain-containing protein [Leifsonia sp. NPDC058230]|uniref:DUF4386 domain-containing protein n=1 Tax=Leifsonia sp. NPDC058230 TaxID=3346391 RepID=UPI0036DCCED1
MTTASPGDTLLAIGLIAVPLAFTAFYAALAATFHYPAVLREPAGEVLARFRAGGTRLVLLWWAFAMTAVAFIPVAVGAAHLAGPDLAALTLVIGVLAGLVQALGLLRWPFLVPQLARDRERSPEAVDAIFDATNRYLGVAIGEHLGYLLTGGWTILLSAGLLATGALPGWFAIVGIVIGAALLIGCFEFVGPAERDGWAFAGAVVAVAYTAWSLWLILGGVLLLVLPH